MKIAPDPGAYRTSIQISFICDPSCLIHYRLGQAAPWTTYDAPFWLHTNATVACYAQAATGHAKSVIHAASYTFSEPLATRDSDADGVPDYVELAHGLDPVSSGKAAAGDGYTDKEELIAGTDPIIEILEDHRVGLRWFFATQE